MKFWFYTSWAVLEVELLSQMFPFPIASHICIWLCVSTYDFVCQFCRVFSAYTLETILATAFGRRIDIQRGESDQFSKSMEYIVKGFVDGQFEQFILVHSKFHGIKFNQWYISDGTSTWEGGGATVWEGVEQLCERGWSNWEVGQPCEMGGATMQVGTCCLKLVIL